MELNNFGVMQKNLSSKENKLKENLFRKKIILPF